MECLGQMWQDWGADAEKAGWVDVLMARVLSVGRE